MDDQEDQLPSHDRRGRFARGNPGGPGRPRGRRDELRQAAEDAITAEHVSALMRRALRSGLEGDLPATKFVVETVCGKAIPVPGETAALDIEFPEMRTAADCDAALERLGKAICSGNCDPTTVRLMIDVVQARLKAIELGELEQRLTELERSAGMVDPLRGPVAL